MPNDRNKPGRPTIRAIAERAGVSRSTVSLILANRQDMVGRFKPETVARVRAAAQQMGYRANLMAISLRSSHPTFFGLILRGTGRNDAISWHHQAFEGQFLNGALEASRSLGLYPVLATQDSPDPAGALHRVTGVLDGGVFGAVLRTPLPVLDDPMRHQIELGLPVVIVFPEHPTTCPSNAIDMDNIAAGHLAARLFREAGRHRWVVVREELMWDAIRLRERGMLETAPEAGAHTHVLSVPPGLGETEMVVWLTPKLAELKPDAVFAASSIMGLSVLFACERAGLRVPEQTCLVGCDTSLWRAPGCPGITSIDVSWYAAGDLAVRKMAELSAKEESTFDNINLPPKIRKGETCPGGEEEPPPVMAHQNRPR